MDAEPYCPEPAPEREDTRDEDEDHGLTPWDYDIAFLKSLADIPPLTDEPLVEF